MPFLRLNRNYNIDFLVRRLKTLSSIRYIYIVGTNIDNKRYLLLSVGICIRHNVENRDIRYKIIYFKQNKYLNGKTQKESS